MLNYLWPLALVVISNTLYQICAKSIPNDVDPLASVTATYIVAALVSGVLYFVLNKDANIVSEYSRFNWAPYLLGLVIVGLEAGMIYSYKNGWAVSTLSIVQSVLITIALIGVGTALYHESVSWNKLAGIAVCVAGLVLINI